jgi:hypothetical protein
MNTGEGRRARASLLKAALYIIVRCPPRALPGRFRGGFVTLASVLHGRARPQNGLRNQLNASMSLAANDPRWPHWREQLRTARLVAIR